MPLDPDITAWASVEAVTPHEVACLCLFVNPSAEPGDRFRKWGIPPSIPADVADTVDPTEWIQDYGRIYLLLARAIEEGEIKTTRTGKITPRAAVSYLLTITKRDGWDKWLNDMPYIAAVRTMEDSSKASSTELFNVLRSRISGLESEVAKLRSRESYTTPLLDMAKAVIDEFYAPGASYPKKETVKNFLREKSLPVGMVWSDEKLNAVWAVVSHPSQAKGGQKPLKKL